MKRLFCFKSLLFLLFIILSYGNAIGQSLTVKKVFTKADIGSSTDIIQNIEVDELDNIWIGYNPAGSGISGLFMMDTFENWTVAPSWFIDHNIRNIIKSPGNKIWVADGGRSGSQALQGGALVFNAGNNQDYNRFSCCTPGVDKISSRSVSDILPTSNEISYVLSFNMFSTGAEEAFSGAIDKVDNLADIATKIAYGNNYYNFSTASFTNDYSTFLNGTIHKNEIWTTRLVYPLTGSSFAVFESYPLDSPSPSRVFTSGNSIFPLGSSSAFPRVQDVYSDKSGNLWIGINEGSTDVTGNFIAKFNAQNSWDTLPAFHIIKDFINSKTAFTVNTIKEDENSNIWFATNYGLIRYNGTSFNSDASWSIYDTLSGLPTNSIFDIAFDSKGFMWLSTNVGIVKIEMPSDCEDINDLIELTSDFENDIVCGDRRITLTTKEVIPNLNGIYQIFDSDSLLQLNQPISTNNTGIFTVFAEKDTTNYFVRFINECNDTSNIVQKTIFRYSEGGVMGRIITDTDNICNNIREVTISKLLGNTGTNGTYVLYDGDPLEGGVELDRDTSGVFTRQLDKTTTFHIRAERDSMCPFVSQSVYATLFVLDTIKFKVDDVRINNINNQIEFIPSTNTNCFVQLLAVNKSTNDTIKYSPLAVYNSNNYKGSFALSDEIDLADLCNYSFTIRVFVGLSPYITLDFKFDDYKKGVDSALVWYPKALLDQIINLSSEADSVELSTSLYDVEGFKKEPWSKPFFNSAVGNSFVNDNIYNGEAQEVLKSFWRFYILQKVNNELIKTSDLDVQNSIPWAAIEQSKIFRELTSSLFSKLIFDKLIEKLKLDSTSKINTIFALYEENIKKIESVLGKNFFINNVAGVEIINMKKDATNYLFGEFLKKYNEINPLNFHDLYNEWTLTFLTNYVINSNYSILNPEYNNLKEGFFDPLDTQVPDYNTAYNTTLDKLTIDLSNIETDINDIKNIRITQNITETVQTGLDYSRSVLLPFISNPVGVLYLGYANLLSKSLEIFSIGLDGGLVLNLIELNTDLKNIRKNYADEYGKGVYLREGNNTGILDEKIQSLNSMYLTSYLPEVKSLIIENKKDELSAETNNWIAQSMLFTDSVSYALYHLTNTLSNIEGFDSLNTIKYNNLINLSNQINGYDASVKIYTSAFVNDSLSANWSAIDSFDIQYNKLLAAFEAFENEYQNFESLIEITPVNPILVCDRIKIENSLDNGDEMPAEFKISNISDVAINNVYLLVFSNDGNSTIKLDSIFIGTIDANSSNLISKSYVLNTSTYGIQLSVEVFGDNARGFGDDALLFLKEAPTKLITNNNTLQFKVYPSPANNLISIELNTEEEFQIEIIDVLGRVLYTNRIYKNMNVDISKFPKNMYFVKVYKGNQKAVKGFVKN